MEENRKDQQTCQNEQRTQVNHGNSNLNNPDEKLVRGGVEMDIHKVMKTEILDI